MKKMLLVSILTLLSTAAMADIPNMGKHKSEEVTSTQITGAAAEAIYESIDMAPKMEASLRTSATSYKVLRADDGLDQVICHKTSGSIGRKKVSYDCTTESSNTEDTLPVYKPAIKMG